MLAVIDTETTGLVAGVHEIVQIAVIPLSEQLEPMGRFVSYIKPMRPQSADPKAFEVNHLTLEGLATQPTPSQVRGALKDWKDNCYGDVKFIPLGHNYAGFDKGFIQLFLGTELYNNMLSYHCEDTMILARAMKRAGVLSVENCSLDGLTAFFGIERRVCHDAFEDAMATAKLYKELLKILAKS
jgi:DNA polymerase III epsilon subunit-like protein